MATAVYYNSQTGWVTSYDSSANTPIAQAAGALINPNLSAVANLPISRWKVVNGAVIDGGEQIATVKQDLIDRINVLTESKIHDGPGFEYPQGSGKFYSLSENAQAKWIGLEVGRAAIDYVNDPPTVRTKDDQITTILTSSDMVHAMYLTGLATVKAYLKAGGIVKDAVRDAATIAAARAAAEDYLNS